MRAFEIQLARALASKNLFLFLACLYQIYQYAP